MKKTLITLIFTILSISTFSQEIECGHDRWKVKTLTDSDAAKIDKKPRKVKISDLITVFPKVKIGNSTARNGIEFNVYTVQCYIREYRKEDDNDYHLVLVDINDSTKTMIAEIPHPACTDSSKNKYVKYFVQVRKEFEKYKRKKYKVEPGVYEITGVFFYDRIHGQLGVAPNGAELHPILKFKKIR